MNKQELKQTLKFTENLAKKIGEFLLHNQSKVTVLNYKDKQDILTNIDLEAEKIIIDAIEEKFASHSVFSEEKGLIDKNSDYKWIIDPLDGTKEYLRHIPQFTTSIALEYKSTPIIAVNYHVSPHNIYSAGKGIGAYHNSKILKVSKQDDISNSIIHLRLPASSMSTDLVNTQMKLIEGIVNSCYRVRGVVHENTVLCWLASGGLEGYVYLGQGSVKGWWDVVTGYLILKEAGGKITDLKGESFKSENISDGIIASNGKIHNDLINILK